MNELKDAFAQLYAYTGFPRSLNALNTLERVLSERKSVGIIDNEGKPFQRPAIWDDAKLALQQYLTENPLLAKTPLTKKQVKEIFFKNPLKYFSKKSVDALADFFFNKALDNAKDRYDYLLRYAKLYNTEEK